MYFLSLILFSPLLPIFLLQLLIFPFAHYHKFPISISSSFYLAFLFSLFYGNYILPSVSSLLFEFTFFVIFRSSFLLRSCYFLLFIVHLFFYFFFCLSFYSFTFFISYSSLRSLLMVLSSLFSVSSSVFLLPFRFTYLVIKNLFFYLSLLRHFSS